MAERVWVRPKRGLVVPDPDMGDRFPAEGRRTSRTLYIERRIADKSLIVMTDDEVAAMKSDRTAKAETAAAKQSDRSTGAKNVRERS